MIFIDHPTSGSTQGFLYLADSQNPFNVDRKDLRKAGGHTVFSPLDNDAQLENRLHEEPHWSGPDVRSDTFISTEVEADILIEKVG